VWVQTQVKYISVIWLVVLRSWIYQLQFTT